MVISGGFTRIRKDGDAFGNDVDQSRVASISKKFTNFHHLLNLVAVIGNMLSARTASSRVFLELHRSVQRPVLLRSSHLLCRARTGTTLLLSSQIRPASSFGAAQKPPFRDRFREQWRLAKKDYPILLPVLIVATIASVSVLGLLLYDDYSRVSPQFSAYPPAVELRLRQALQYVHVTPDPELAEKQFTEALRAAQDAGMDPYSPEVMGIRTRLAEMLEKFGRIRSAIEVLEGTVTMCEEKIADIGRGAVTGDPENTNSLRKGMLKTAIRSRVKVAELYEGDYMQKPAKAKEMLSDAIGLLVKSTPTPETNAFGQDNAAGLPLEEVASMLCRMGDLYATTGEESNAVEVYILAIPQVRQACNGKKSCQEVQLLSNIASTMDVALKKPGAKINGQPATKQSLAAARRATLRWADHAIAAAEAVKPEDRDQTCELGLISAEMTRADMLLEDGKNIQAREAFRSIVPKLREKGLEELVRSAEQGIRRAGG